MPNTFLPVELGLSEFLSVLVNEVAQGVAAANAQQMAVRNAVCEALDMADEAFAKRFIKEADLVQALGDEGFVLRNGQLDPKDLEAAVRWLNEQGVALPAPGPAPVPIPEITRLLKERMKAILVEARRAELQTQVSTQVLPRVTIDSGEIHAKVVMRALKQQPPGGKAVEGEIVLRTARQVLDLITANAAEFPGLRLAVKPAGSSDAGAADTLAEIRVTFKTL